MVEDNWCLVGGCDNIHLKRFRETVPLNHNTVL